MSRIFEALQETDSEAAALVSTLVAGEPAGAGARTMVPAAPQTPAADEPEARPAEETATGPTPEQEAAPEPKAAPPVRRVKLVIPASVPVMPFEDQNELAAEQYRIARTKIIHHPRRPRIIEVTSPSTRDGKTITAVNVAGALSLKVAAKILLVDVDFRRSAIHALLGLDRSPGLAEVIGGACALEDAVVEPEEYPNLNILTSGECLGNPSELLESPRWHALCGAFRARYEYVVLDAPPIGSVADCELIQLSADGVLVVLRPEHTKRSGCFKALESIAKEKLIGAVLNGIRSWPLDKQSGGYGHGYGYPYGHQPGTDGRPAPEARQRES